MKNSAVYSFLTDTGSHPSLIFETAQHGAIQAIALSLLGRDKTHEL